MKFTLVDVALLMLFVLNVPVGTVGVQLAPVLIRQVNRCVVLSAYIRSVPAEGFEGAEVSVTSKYEDMIGVASVFADSVCVSVVPTSVLELTGIACVFRSAAVVLSEPTVLRFRLLSIVNAPPAAVS